MPSMKSRALALTLPILIALSGCNTLPLKSADSESGHADPLSPRVQAQSATEQQQAAATTTAAEPTPMTELTENAANGGATAPEDQPAATPPPDLWQRVFSNYALTIPKNSRVQQQIDWFARHDKHILRLQERATPYLHFIVEEIEKRGMPGELALLPAIESAFRPFAFSAGRAAGLWQFIPSTGKLYGLHQNWWYDGRRDIVAATEAALDHLKELAEQFDGDWELALAAYNAGAGGVSRAIRNNANKGKPTDFWNLDLPRETRGYVPRLLALAEVMAHTQQYGISLMPLENRPYFESVDIQSQLDLALAADLAGISTDELYRLNPGFNRWATAPEGPHRLNIPMDKAAQFREKLAGLAPNDRLKWTRYQIRPGDNLGAIAHKFGTTVALLRQINKLNGNLIRAGRHLLIPVSSRSLDQYTAMLQASQPAAGRSQSYTVRSGDSFWSIAQQHDISHKDLAGWNNLPLDSTLQPGQKLTIHGTAVKQIASLPGRVASGLTTRSSVRYQVRRGDSLYSIAERFKVSVADLRKWNRLPGKYLQPGQTINLYVDVTGQTL